MRIVVPAVETYGIYRETLKTLLDVDCCIYLLPKSVDNADAQMRKYRDEAYYRLFTELWVDNQDFLIIEPDMVVQPQFIQEVEQCRELWCVRTYSCSDDKSQQIVALGFARFSAELMEQLPQLPQRLLMHAEDGTASCPWWSLDTRIYEELIQKHQPCIHGTIQHLHDYAKYGTNREKASVAHSIPMRFA